MAVKPPLHGRDHRPGGADPIPGLGSSKVLKCSNLTAGGQAGSAITDFAGTRKNVWISCSVAFNQGLLDEIVANIDTRPVVGIAPYGTHNLVEIGDPTGLGYVSWTMEFGDPTPLASTPIVASRWYDVIFHDQHLATPLNVVSLSIDGAALTVAPHDTADHSGGGVFFGHGAGSNTLGSSGYDGVIYFKNMLIGTSSGASDITDASDLSTGFYPIPFTDFKGTSETIQLVADPF